HGRDPHPPRQATPRGACSVPCQLALRGDRRAHPLDPLPRRGAPGGRPDARRRHPGAAGSAAALNVLVTGAHGFLGSHVAERLLAAGDGVIALVSPWGELTNLEHVTEHPRLRVVRADLTRPGSLEGVCEGVAAVVHAAARV